MDDGRTLRRKASMRRAQAAALDLFESDGFSSVTVEQVAARAGLGPASIYRNFGTKEGLVLWDDYDPKILEALDARLPSPRPLAAIFEALSKTVDAVYRRDKQRILRRTRLISSVPNLRAANDTGQAQLAALLAQVFADNGVFRDAFARAVVAATITAALQVAVLSWAEQNAKRPLRHFLARALQTIGDLSAG